LGYTQLENTSVVQAIIKAGELVDSIDVGDEAIVVLAQSSFYGESGGQVGDNGILGNQTANFEVDNTQKQKSGAFEHHGTLSSGALKVGDAIEASVDKNRRKRIARNHSATHLLHAALRSVLGENVTQKGSLVDGNKLRFDFSHDEVIAKVDLDKIEAMVNRRILGNSIVHTDVTDIKTAKQKGAIALFGEKYGDTVRVLTMGKDDFSVELCGGTHVKRLGDIGLFRIVSEGGIAAGVRRIEAMTGYDSYQFDKETEESLFSIAQMTKSNNAGVVEKSRSVNQASKGTRKANCYLPKSN
jgi:alanyl-tRNA synthetase (EC 6.1.1.7)